ncbi:MAG: hypothetical protein NTY38_12825, partial [Acidobacteria bacterium]|nr:hypothetical protein [Acidobacteriota bacterium]
MDDMKLALEDVRDSPETPLLAGVPVPGDVHRRWLLGWGVAAALASGLLSLAFLHFREKPSAPAAPLHFQLPAPENAAAFSISPDARKVAFFARNRLWVHFLESGESRDLTAAEGGVPFWSPDSRFLGYASQGKLKKIEATGGPPQTVTDLRSGYPWGGGAWNQDDVIVFADVAAGLFRVPAAGGEPVQITALDPARQESAQFCP